MGAFKPKEKPLTDSFGNALATEVVSRQTPQSASEQQAYNSNARDDYRFANDPYMVADLNGAPRARRELTPETLADLPSLSSAGFSFDPDSISFEGYDFGLNDQINTLNSSYALGDSLGAAAYMDNYATARGQELAYQFTHPASDVPVEFSGAQRSLMAPYLQAASQPQLSLWDRASNYVSDRMLIGQEGYNGDFLHDGLAAVNNVFNVPVNLAGLGLGIVGDGLSWSGGDRLLEASMGLPGIGGVSQGMMGIRAMAAVRLEGRLATSSLGRVSSRPEWLQRLDAGNAFNQERAAAYPYNEVYINKASGDGYYRLDSYNPISGEIVSRKFTQFSNINEQTAMNYVSEIGAKYPVGATIAKVPSSGNLAGQSLQGQLILEVPVQVKPIPQSVINAADNAGVLIRDINGKVH